MDFITDTYLGYKYIVEQEVIDLKEAGKEYKGYPKEPQNETYYWFDYYKAPMDNFWYIIYSPGVEVLLGEPYQFEVRFPIEDPI